MAEESLGEKLKKATLVYTDHGLSTDAVFKADHICTSRIPISIPEAKLERQEQGYGILTIEILGRCQRCNNLLVVRQAMVWDGGYQWYAYREYWIRFYFALRTYIDNFVGINSENPPKGL